MLASYFKIALRTIAKDFKYVFISLLSLSVGIAIAIISLLYIYNELRYDTHYANAERIYRVGCRTKMGDNVTEWAPAPAPLAKLMQQQFPQIENHTRIAKVYDVNEAHVVIEYEDKKVSENSFLAVDTTFFEIFDCQFISGASESFMGPDKIVLTETLSRKIFHDADAVGKTLRIWGKELLVAGVVKDQVQNTHLKFNALVSWNTFQWQEPWLDAYAYTYVLLHPHADVEAFKDKLPKFVQTNIAEKVRSLEADVSLILQPLTSIHLRSHLNAELSTNGYVIYVYIFGLLTVFFLIICVSNYVNLSIARSRKRTKEIGIRQAMGSSKAEIARQVLFESMVFTSVAAVIGGAIAFILLPAFNNAISENLEMTLLKQPVFIIICLMLVLVVGAASGTYPAFFIAKFNAVETLKNTLNVKEGLISIRRVLVVVQFSVSIVMIVSTIVVTRQLSYIFEKDLGFNKERIFYVDTPIDFDGNPQVVKDDLLSDVNIVSASLCLFRPGQSSKDEFKLELPEGDRIRVVQQLYVDYDFIPLMGMQMVAGRNFDYDNSSDQGSAFIVNEEAVRTFGWKDPIGKKIVAINQEKAGVVIGVVKDANIYSLHSKIQPLVVQLIGDNHSNSSIFIKYNGDAGLAASINSVREVFAEYYESPVEPVFLSDEYDRLYVSERKLSFLVSLATMLMVGVSCIGLFGLSSFMAEQSTKEMSLRKVFGASSLQLIFVHMKKFLSMALIANLISWPLAYFLLNIWLQGFAYRTNISLVVFLIAAVLTLVIVFLTTNFHAMLVARVNPSKALKHM